MTKYNFDESDLIQPTDFEKKCNSVLADLYESLFRRVDNPYGEDEIEENSTNKAPKKKKYAKNEITPLLTPVQVNSKLNELLRIYRPFTTSEAKEQPDFVYLQAFRWYMHLITEINRYIAFLPSKQTFCAFANITVATYNELLYDTNYAQVFSSAEDYFIDSNYTSAQAGIVDSRTTIAKVQMKDSGHNQVKNPDSIGSITVNQIDKDKVNLELDRFIAMIDTKKSKTKN